VRWIKEQPTVNHELGRSQAQIPVMHTHATQDPVVAGLWFYYGRGCSDFAWATGRTLLVRNKCHAAVLLEQWATNSTWSISSRRVAWRLAEALKRKDFTEGWAPWNFTQDPVSLSVVEIASALRPCVLGKDDLVASALVQQVITSNALDYVSAQTLRRISGTPRELDTIQFANQCADPKGQCPFGNGHVEIWDVRVFQRRSGGGSYSGSSDTSLSGRRSDTTKHSSELVYSRLDGASCALADGWWHCLACRDSYSEAMCKFECVNGVPQRGAGNYSSFHPRILERLSPIRRDQPSGPLALASIWSSTWGSLLQCVRA
jgi:hypothetical protein